VNNLMVWPLDNRR